SHIHHHSISTLTRPLRGHFFRLVVSSFAPLFFFFYCYGDHRDLHSFPTRRSSDLPAAPRRAGRVPRPRGRTSGRRSARRESAGRSEEHTSELQSRSDLVCRLLLEKKKKKKKKK